MLWFSSSKFGNPLLPETLFHLFDAISLEALCINVRVQMETEFHDQILRIEKETRKGKESYEAIVNKDGKETAIQVDASGKYLGTHDEKAEHQKAENAEKH